MRIRGYTARPPKKSSKFLLFRDWLREHPEDRERYEQAKRGALKGACHVMDYNLRKQSVIRNIYARAFKARDSSSLARLPIWKLLQRDAPGAEKLLAGERP